LGSHQEAQEKTRVYPYHHRSRTPLLPKVVTVVTTVTLIPVIAELLERLCDALSRGETGGEMDRRIGSLRARSAIRIRRVRISTPHKRLLLAIGFAGPLDPLGKDLLIPPTVHPPPRTRNVALLATYSNPRCP
jgi:hypothetical protein